MKTYGTLDNPFPELPPAATFDSVSWVGDMAVELRNSGYGSTATQYKYSKYDPVMDTSQGSLCYWVKVTESADGSIFWDNQSLIEPGVYQGGAYAGFTFQSDGNFIERNNTFIAEVGEVWWVVCRDTGASFDRWIAVQMSWNVPDDLFTIAVDGRVRAWTYQNKLNTVRTMQAPQQIVMISSLEIVAYYDVWLSREFIDFDRADNIARFITGDKKPSPLGETGIRGSPTERRPEFFFHCKSGDDPQRFFSNNLGTEGPVATEGTTDTVFKKVAKPLMAGEP